MPECSLCGKTMPEEGGAVLFTDGQGVPFEVCGECEARFETLRSAGDEADAGRAVDYIFEKAGSLDRRRDVFDMLVGYVEACRPRAAEAESEADQPEEPLEEEAADAGAGKRGWIKSGILVAVIVVLLLLALFLGGFHF